MIAILFWSFLLAATFSVAIMGSAMERRFLTLILICVSSTFFLNSRLGWMDAQPFVLLLDMGLLITSLALTSFATCFWPIWFSAFQAIAVATGLAQFLFPNHVPAIYIAVQGFWFLPALMSMTVGVIMDSRQEI